MSAGLVMIANPEDRMRVEQAIPAYMYALLFESLRKDGFEVRADLEELANKASAGALEGTVGEHQQRLAAMVEQEGYGILKDAGENSVTVLIGGLSRCLCKLVDNGAIVNQDAMLIALSIAAEMDDGVEDWGRPIEANRVMVALDNEMNSRGVLRPIL